MHIDQMHEGQEIIIRYHDKHGRIRNENPVRFSRADLEPPLFATATFLRQNDDGVWGPFLVHRFGGEWVHGPRQITFRAPDKFPAGAVAVDIDSDRPGDVLHWMSDRLGRQIDDGTPLTEITAEALHLEWQAATLMLR